MSRADVAVVGAGPAGTSAALALATVGARVMLFDPSHPREKPCGGGLTARAQELVADVVRSPELDAVPITSVRFESISRRPLRASLPLAPAPSGYPRLVGVNRSTFDAALLEATAAAGVSLVRERVLDVGFDDQAAHLRTAVRSYQAGLVIGADGAMSLVRRRVGTPFNRAQLSWAAGFYVPGWNSQEIVIRFIANPPGYMWAFPRHDRVAAGMCVRGGAATVQALQANVATWLDELSGGPAAKRCRYAWPIPSLSATALDRERPAGDRWLLVGDAAGLVDPLTREGIYFALRSGRLAAAAIAQTASAASAAYVAALRRAIYPELSRATRLAAGFFTEDFIELLLRALRESHKVRSVMADLVAGRQPYKTLRMRLLRTAEVRLARRLLGLRLGRRP